MLQDKVSKILGLFTDQELNLVYRDLSYFAGPGFIFHTRRDLEWGIRKMPYENLVGIAGRLYFHLPPRHYLQANEILGLEILTPRKAILQVREKYLIDNLDKMGQSMV